MTSKALVLGGSAGGPWVLKSYSWAVVCRFHDTLIDPCHPCKEGKNTTTQNEVNLSKSFNTISKSINYQSYWASELCVSCIIKQHLRHIFGSKNGTHQLVLNGVDNGMIRKHHQKVQNSTTMTCIFLDGNNTPSRAKPRSSLFVRFCPTWKAKVGQRGLGWQHYEFCMSIRTCTAKKCVALFKWKSFSWSKGLLLLKWSPMNRQCQPCAQMCGF